MDYTVFYYTYSTISQTLAGAFGFLAALVLFQMQYLLSKRESMFRGFGDARMKANDSSHHDPERAQRLNQQIQEYLETEERKLSSAREGLPRSLKWTACTIAACLVFMPMTCEGMPLGHPLVAWVFLLPTVAAAILTLRIYLVLVLTVMAPTKFPPEQG
ncbi:hypothetical protein [Tautonia plasticadhaerens]|uniref:Uncharacterized protein n=1 Tax=Tautonia plasticadhaerens TaxID=2527974 RepID=A0A518GZN8_9BACT|nr:hypothetical protein [Tautonia plasticadhaerens]QDV34050.1 hypothetical protein ElP_19310 [Tautonia plasticadhaerens]